MFWLCYHGRGCHSAGVCVVKEPIVYKASPKALRVINIEHFPVAILSSRVRGGPLVLLQLPEHLPPSFHSQQQAAASDTGLAVTCLWALDGGQTPTRPAL